MGIFQGHPEQKLVERLPAGLPVSPEVEEPRRAAVGQEQEDREERRQGTSEPAKHEEEEELNERDGEQQPWYEKGPLDAESVSEQRPAEEIDQEGVGEPGAVKDGKVPREPV